MKLEVPYMSARTPFLIAEIGINHNGDVDLAKRMIADAAEAGFDAVKFQKREIDLVYDQATLESYRESPWGTTQRAQKDGLEFGRAEYDEIDRYCRAVGIVWSASCWDLASFDLTRSYDPPFHKVASPMLGHVPMLRAIVADGRKVFVSTGMSNWKRSTRLSTFSSLPIARSS